MDVIEMEVWELMTLVEELCSGDDIK